MSSLLSIQTPKETCLEVAAREKARRKGAGLTQAQLARQSGVSLGSLRRFEQTGEISLHALARLALALGCDKDFEALFERPAYRSIQEVIDAQSR